MHFISGDWCRYLGKGGGFFDNHGGYIPYQDYLRSDEWERTRSMRYELSGDKCHKCGRSRKQARFLEVHHKTYKNLPFERMSDLMVMCGHCHEAWHQARNPVWKTRRIDETLPEWLLDTGGDPRYGPIVHAFGVADIDTRYATEKIGSVDLMDAVRRANETTIPVSTSLELSDVCGVVKSMSLFRGCVQFEAVLARGVGMRNKLFPTIVVTSYAGDGWYATPGVTISKLRLLRESSGIPISVMSVAHDETKARSMARLFPKGLIYGGNQ